MAKKLTIEFIYADFLSYKYILLTKIYINNKQKLEYICPNGHQHFITWKNWNTGQRCPTCNNNNKKFTIEFVKKSFKNNKYILKTEKYINAHQKLEYICPKGHKHSMSWSHWQRGIRCPTCANNYKKLGIELIKKEFEKKMYNLLTTEYTNSFQKLDYVCPEGHKHFMTWSNWRQGRRCPTCWAIQNFGDKTSNWRGGISKEPYCQDWTKDLKNFVKERDGYKCMNPDCWCKDNMLHVHHINYNKKACGPENLITVCRSCNSRANFNRRWYKAWYKTILYRRYGYI